MGRFCHGGRMVVMDPGHVNQATTPFIECYQTETLMALFVHKGLSEIFSNQCHFLFFCF